MKSVLYMQSEQCSRKNPLNKYRPFKEAHRAGSGAQSGNEECELLWRIYRPLFDFINDITAAFPYNGDSAECNSGKFRREQVAPVLGSFSGA